MKKILLIATFFVVAFTTVHAQTKSNGVHLLSGSLTSVQNLDGTITYTGSIVGLGNQSGLVVEISSTVSWSSYACINPGNHNVEAQGGGGSSETTTAQSITYEKNGRVNFSITTAPADDPSGGECPNNNWTVIYNGLTTTNAEVSWHF